MNSTDDASRPMKTSLLQSVSTKNIETQEATFGLPVKSEPEVQCSLSWLPWPLSDLIAAADLGLHTH